MTSPRTLLVGIGSSHGDDRVGWLLAQQVAAQLPGDLDVRCAGAPAELLGWLDGRDALIVCDAVVADGTPGECRAWDWPAEEIRQARFTGSHDLSLAAVLALAGELGRLPARVRVWAITIESAEPCGPLSPAVAAAVPRVAKQICGALCHA